jgi:hypothetical protein
MTAAQSGDAGNGVAEILQDLIDDPGHARHRGVLGGRRTQSADEERQPDLGARRT